MEKSIDKLSVLLAGCGSIGKRHARVLARLGVKDIRVCDPSAAQAESLVQETPCAKIVPSYEAGLAQKPDCAFVLTPPALHVPMARQALAAGVPVFLEKPVSDTLTGIDEMEKEAADKGLPLMVGLCFRYHEGLKKAKALLDAGAIGRLVSVRALMGEHFPSVRPDYKTLFSAKVLGALDLIHDVDLAIWYIGQTPDTVSIRCGSFSDIGIEAPDVAEILMGFPDRALATVHLDFFQQPRRRQIELIGTKGTIVVEFASWDVCHLDVYQEEVGAWEKETIPTQRDDMFRDEDLAFLRAVLGEGRVECTPAEAAKSLAVIMQR